MLPQRASASEVAAWLLQDYPLHYIIIDYCLHWTRAMIMIEISLFSKMVFERRGLLNP